MPEIDVMKQAEDEFLDAVDTAAKKLAAAIRAEAARKVIAQMSLTFNSHVPPGRDVLKPYVAEFGGDLFASSPRKETDRRATYVRDAIVSQIIAFVKKHPGLRIEQINARFDTKTGDLARLVSQAIASGKLVTKGKARGRKYYPGKKA